jgi:sugar phosphate permease
MEVVAAPARSVRWRIPAVLGVTMVVNYLDRNNLALALPRIAQEFGWSDREVGANGELLLGAFFLAFGIANVLLSPLAERMGSKRSVLFALAAYSICTILMGPLGFSLLLLIALRLLLGVGEGVHIPMLSAITSRWFPPHERSRANALWGVGILVATALAPLGMVPLISAFGWRAAFAMLGLVGMLVSIPLVSRFIEDQPRERDGVSPAELAYIRAGQAHIAGLARDEPHYARTGRFWLVTLGGTLNAFCAFGVLNWLPTYFTRAKGIDFEQLGWPLALVFAAGVAGVLVMAYLGDRLSRRALLAGGGFLVAAGLVALAPTVGTVPALVALFAGAVFCQGAFQAQEYAIVQRVVPAAHVGAGTGLYNGLSVLFGGVGGSLIPGSIVAATGSFDAGIRSIFVGALLASAVMFALARVLRY